MSAAPKFTTVRISAPRARPSRAHDHAYDVHPRADWSTTHCVCTICGFAVNMSALSNVSPAQMSSSLRAAIVVRRLVDAADAMRAKFMMHEDEHALAIAGAYDSARAALAKVQS